MKKKLLTLTILACLSTGSSVSYAQSSVGSTTVDAQALLLIDNQTAGQAQAVRITGLPAGAAGANVMVIDTDGYVGFVNTDDLTQNVPFRESGEDNDTTNDAAAGSASTSIYYDGILAIGNDDNEDSGYTSEIMVWDADDDGDAQIMVSTGGARVNMFVTANGGDVNIEDPAVLWRMGTRSAAANGDRAGQIRVRDESGDDTYLWMANGGLGINTNAGTSALAVAGLAQDDAAPRMVMSDADGNFYWGDRSAISPWVNIGPKNGDALLDRIQYQQDVLIGNDVADQFNEDTRLGISHPTRAIDSSRCGHGRTGSHRRPSMAMPTLQSRTNTAAPCTLVPTPA